MTITVAGRSRNRMPLERKEDVQPVCPHCERELQKVWMRELESVLAKRYIYFCPDCRKVLGVSHRKGFWMGRAPQRQGLPVFLRSPHGATGPACTFARFLMKPIDSAACRRYNSSALGDPGSTLKNSAYGLDG